MFDMPELVSYFLYQRGKDGSGADHAFGIFTDIKEARKFLDNQEKLWQRMFDKYSVRVCQKCFGEGGGMQFQKSDLQEDGPRNYACPDCNGRGIRVSSKGSES